MLNTEVDFNSADYVFHYTTLNIALEEILFKKKIKLSSSLTLSDRYEKKINFSDNLSGSFWEKLRDYFRKQKERGYYKASFCQNVLNQNSDIYGWAKPSMWDYYSDSHCGVCLVFSRKLLIKYMKELTNKYRPHAYCYEMKYQSEVPEIDLENNMFDIFKRLIDRKYKSVKDNGLVDTVVKYKDFFENYELVKKNIFEDKLSKNESLSNKLEEILSTLHLLSTLHRPLERESEYLIEDIFMEYIKNQECFNSLCAIKYSDYQNEREFRVGALLTNSEEKNRFFDFQDSLKGLIVGDSVSPSYYPSILDFSQKLSICVKKIDWSDDQPKLKELS